MAGKTVKSELQQAFEELSDAYSMVSKAYKYLADVGGYYADAKNDGTVTIDENIQVDVDEAEVDKRRDIPAVPKRPATTDDVLNPEVKRPGDVIPSVEDVRTALNGYLKKVGKKVAIALLAKHTPSCKVEDLDEAARIAIMGVIDGN